MLNIAVVHYSISEIYTELYFTRKMYGTRVNMPQQDTKQGIRTRVSYQAICGAV